MKKSILVLSLVSMLTIGGSALAFASTATTDSGFGFRNNGTTGVQNYMDEGLSFEDAKKEMLQIKFERIDKAVEDGSITSEKATEIKKELEENSASCTTPGENQGEHKLGQILSYGNGNGPKDGSGYRRGNGSGFGRNGNCTGICINAES